MHACVPLLPSSGHNLHADKLALLLLAVPDLHYAPYFANPTRRIFPPASGLPHAPSPAPPQPYLPGGCSQSPWSTQA